VLTDLSLSLVLAHERLHAHVVLLEVLVRRIHGALLRVNEIKSTYQFAFVFFTLVRYYVTVSAQVQLHID